MSKYEQTVYLFKEINPTKKFSQFSYTDLNWSEVQIGYCNKQEVLKIDGKFWMFSGEVSNHWDEKSPSIIRFKSRSKTIREIPA